MFAGFNIQDLSSDVRHIRTSALLIADSIYET